MFLLFYFISPRRLKSHASILSQNTPNFQKIPVNYVNLNEKIGIDTTILSTFNNEISQGYYRCSLSIDEVKFENCFAFGSGYSQGNGGAIFIGCGSLLIANKLSLFSKNFAKIGGAICSFCSSLNIKNAQLLIETLLILLAVLCAFKDSFKKTKTKKTSFYSQSAIFNIKGEGERFISNTAGELGGAIAVSIAAPCNIEGVSFIGNTAGHSGGAIYSSNAPLSLMSCNFIDNKAGVQSSRGMNEEHSDVKLRSGEAPRFAVKGGGAICFYASKINGINNVENPVRNLYSDKCCFSGNSANCSVSFGGGAGNTIMLSGHVTFSSFDDYINTSSIHISKNMNNSKGYEVPLINIYNAKDEEKCSGSETSVYSEMNIVYPENKRTASSSVTFVPSPSKYTYRATPITELPYATTKSWTRYSTAKIITAPSARTVRNTFSATLIETEQNATLSSAQTLMPTVSLGPNQKYSYTYLQVSTICSSSLTTVFVTYSTKTNSFDEDGVPIITVSYYTKPEQSYIYDYSMTKKYTKIIIDESNKDDEETGLSTYEIIVISIIVPTIILIVATVFLLAYYKFYIAESSSSTDTSDVKDLIEENTASTVDNIPSYSTVTTTAITENNDDNGSFIGELEF